MKGDGEAAPARVVNTVLLDFGGTLDSDGVHWSTQLAAAFASSGVLVERSALDRAFLAVDHELERWPPIATCSLEEHAVEQARRMLVRLDLDEERAPAVGRGFARRAEAQLRRSAELLSAARSGGDRPRFGVVSNFTTNLERILHDVGLDRQLDVVVCSEAVGLRKPDAAIFRLALDRLGARADEAAMIGDSLRADMAPARALGLMTIWLHGDEVFGGGDLSVVDHEVRTLADALALCAPGGGPR
jgi:putative hydrolase of the HAD superfamily